MMLLRATLVLFALFAGLEDTQARTVEDLRAKLEIGATARQIDRFALVEGRVREVARVRGRGFLNFGADWKTDFTIVIAPKDMKRFEADGVAPEDYAGRRVRVHGWLRSYNGPMIDVTHPEQIEVLSP
jgi:hypothetical protein